MALRLICPCSMPTASHGSVVSNPLELLLVGLDDELLELDLDALLVELDELERCAVELLDDWLDRLWLELDEELDELVALWAVLLLDW